MESLPLPRQRQNMNTVPFVKRPQLSNQAHMCLYVSLSLCVCLSKSMCVCVLALACWQSEWNVIRYVCVCVHMFVGGNR